MAERPTVLIVDDSPELRTLVGARLRQSGLFAVVAEGGDGGEALMLAHEHQPTLVLLDTSMPVLDGLECLPLVLAVSPESKVVMYTGFRAAGLADRARELGAVDFVEKSLPLDTLVERLWQHASAPAPGATRPPGRPLRLAQGDDPAARDQRVLDEHLERYREVFDQATIGMATMTLNGSMVRANRALVEMVGRPAGDLIGLDYGVLTRQHGDQLDDALARITEHGEELVAFEHPLESDPPTRTVRVTLTPVRDSRGDPLYVFAQVRDVTTELALRRSEEIFRLLVTAVKDYAIFMLDVHGRVASWNAGAAHIKGYTAEEISGQHFRVFYPPEEQASGHPERNLAMALRDGVHAEEGWRVRRDGSTFWARVVITAVYDDEGRHVGFAKVTRDQTEQRAHEEERRRALEQQAHLLAVTAHELRTPAAVIEGAVGMLREDARLDPGERRQVLEAMASSAQRLQRLLTDLGTASDVQADALALELEAVSLRRVLLSATDRLHAAHADARVRVHVDSDVELIADPARLGQALDNLLENAVRHGRPPVVVSGERTADGVRIVVSDAGPGVLQRLGERVFERFVHAGPAAGSGLGLYLVREIARLHGGEARYATEGPGRPAFVLDLPARPQVPRTEV
ncbi:PAS domain S-box protein [Nocardioides sp. L-11A]|uniref:hybrid sensor histidine kinase/response regulator n=1 Tax=Nocardioides sp. L-11A TaxID=3043848 RepID=UPI00249BF51E|nr:PAS domain S-box protein [Nocardioides sp. L-11A]